MTEEQKYEELDELLRNDAVFAVNDNDGKIGKAILQYLEESSAARTLMTLEEFNDPKPTVPKITDDSTEEEREQARFAEARLASWNESRTAEYRNASRENARLFKNLLDEIEKIKRQLEESQTNHNSIVPKEVTLPNESVINAWSNGLLTATPKELTVGTEPKKDNPRNIEVSLVIDFDDIGEEVKEARRLTEYERAVYSSVCSLYSAGNRILTNSMIYHAMTGSDSLPSETTKNKIAEAVELFRHSDVHINTNDENDMKGRQLVMKNYRAHAIVAEAGTCCRVNGNKVDDCYHLFDMPILYKYADSKNEIIRAPLNMLNAPINKSEATISIIHYLLRRIKIQPQNSKKCGQKNENCCRIRYSAVYDAAGISAENQSTGKMKRARSRDCVRRTLDYWKEQKFILDYREYTLHDKRNPEGVEIDLIPQK